MVELVNQLTVDSEVFKERFRPLLFGNCSLARAILIDFSSFDDYIQGNKRKEK
jgi:hypothetical protein